MNPLVAYLAFSFGIACVAAGACWSRYTSRWIVALVFVAALVAWPVVLVGELARGCK